MFQPADAPACKVCPKTPPAASSSWQRLSLDQRTETDPLVVTQAIYGPITGPLAPAHCPLPIALSGAERRNQAVAKAQAAFEAIAQQLIQAWSEVDFTQPHWTRMAIGSLLLSLPAGVSAVAFHAITTPPQPQCNLPQQFQADLAQLQCLHRLMQSGEINPLIQSLRQLQAWPSDSPVYGVSQRLLEDWSLVALSLANHEFEAGRWDNAARLVLVIPSQVSSRAEAQKRLTLWQQIQTQGEQIYALAQQALAQQDWQAARSHAQTLASLSNDYWRQQGLEELPNQIELASQIQQPQTQHSQTQQRQEEAISRGTGQVSPAHSNPSAPVAYRAAYQPALPAPSKRSAREFALGASLSMPMPVSLDRLTVTAPGQLGPEFSAGIATA